MTTRDIVVNGFLKSGILTSATSQDDEDMSAIDGEMNEEDNDSDEQEEDDMDENIYYMNKDY